jgi:hypothetical protein
MLFFRELLAGSAAVIASGRKIAFPIQASQQKMPFRTATPWNTQQLSTP